MIGLRGELHYRQDLGQYKSVCKKNKTPAMIAPRIITKGVAVKPLKLRDVSKLLKTHYGDDWRSFDGLGYFAQVVPQDILVNPDGDEGDDDNPEESMCQLQEELPSLII